MNRRFIRMLLYALFFSFLWICTENIEQVLGSTNQQALYLPLILNQFGITPTETPTASATGPRPTRTRTPTPTRTTTPTTQPFRSATPIPTSTITPTVTLTPTLTSTPTSTPTTTYMPLPELTLVYPTFTPSVTPTRKPTIRPTITQTPAPFFGNIKNRDQLVVLASIGLVWLLLSIWLVILIRRARINPE